MNTLENKQILYKILFDISNINFSLFSESELQLSLLHPLIGLKPRDLLVLFFEMEKYFNIKLMAEDIQDTRFDYIDNILSIVEKRLKMI